MSTPDFFRTRLDTMIDLRHPLAVLATRLPWIDRVFVIPPVCAQGQSWSVDRKLIYLDTASYYPVSVSAMPDVPAYRYAS